MKNKMHVGFIIITASFAVFTLIYIKTGLPRCFSAAIGFGTAFYHFAMRFAIAAVCNSCFKENTGADWRWFRPFCWEKGLYRFLRVKRWKRKIPTYKKEQFDIRVLPLETVIFHSRRAELGHEIILPLCFAPLLMVPLLGAFWIFFSTSLLSALICDLPPVLSQRYNHPRLEWVMRRERRRAAKS